MRHHEGRSRFCLAFRAFIGNVTRKLETFQESFHQHRNFTSQGNLVSLALQVARFYDGALFRRISVCFLGHHLIFVGSHVYMFL